MLLPRKRHPLLRRERTPPANTAHLPFARAPAGNRRRKPLPHWRELESTPHPIPSRRVRKCAAVRFRGRSSRISITSPRRDRTKAIVARGNTTFLYHAASDLPASALTSASKRVRAVL